ncbi:MAG: DUF4406 domain-containing protein [Phycisphaerae bacterium]|nr:MAG: DUF4406 domain-containing protein [Planctomycetota bacterium]MBE7458240.1 DUF4406 domain-containing protein [Planctomycetia bacterium]MCL4718725.1 DUF4406 domain-containing protein [Phycisphaerae bacterium]
MAQSRRIYVSGPMTGYPSCNFAAFHDAAERLTTAGWQVFNPAENFGGRKDLPREAYLRLDLAMLAQCDAIALLAGWEESRGAKLEYAVARELDCAVIDAVTLQPLESIPAPTVVLQHPAPAEPPREEPILDEARRVTEGMRRVEYGEPADDFGRVAHMWTGILARKLREGQTITAMDIPLCMIAIKLARQSHHHKRDNLVDIAGYARTAAMAAGEE